MEHPYNYPGNCLFPLGRECSHQTWKACSAVHTEERTSTKPESCSSSRIPISSITAARTRENGKARRRPAVEPEAEMLPETRSMSLHQSWLGQKNQRSHCTQLLRSVQPAPASLANFKLAAERGLITHLNGTGCLKIGVSMKTTMYESKTNAYRIEPSLYRASSFSPIGAEISNTASVQEMLRNKVRRAKCLPGQILWLGV